MYKYRKPDTWLDKIDLNIMPYVDAPEWENRYPTISALLMSNANKRELQRISAGLTAAPAQDSQRTFQCPRQLQSQNADRL